MDRLKKAWLVASARGRTG